MLCGRRLSKAFIVSVAKWFYYTRVALCVHVQSITNPLAALIELVAHGQSKVTGDKLNKSSERVKSKCMIPIGRLNSC